MKKTSKILLFTLIFTLTGFFSTDNLKSDELPSDELLWCTTVWMPNNGGFIVRCGYCDILWNKKGGNSGSTCPPTAN